MKKDYNETKHLESRQHKINTGFKMEDYQEDVQRTLNLWDIFYCILIIIILTVEFIKYES